MIEMMVESVRASFVTPERLVMLRDRTTDRYLPISIGQQEAFYIAIALQKVAPPRPFSPDLLKSVVQELGARVTQVVVTDLVGETFYARIIMDMSGRHVEVDARPSDAIALALRVHVPIYVEEALLARAGYTPEPERTEPAKGSRGRGGAEREVEQQVDPAKLGAFRDFIASLDDLDTLGKQEK